MKRNLNIIFLIFSLCLTACNQQPSKFEKLKQFMKEAYRFDISDTTLTLLFIPSNQCLNCLNIINIKQSLSKKESNYIIITNGLIPHNNNKNTILDNDSKLMNLEMIDFSNTIIELSANKIMRFENHYPLNKF